MFPYSSRFEPQELNDRVNRRGIIEPGTAVDQFFAFAIAEDGADQAVVVGNSIGSLACVCAAAANPPSIAGVGLFNCAIGMNSKAPPLPDDPVAYALFFNLIGAPPCDRPRAHPATRTPTTACVPRLQPRAPGRLQPHALQASRSSL